MQDLPWMIGSYSVVTLFVFMCASLALDDRTVRFTARERIWVGRIGLAAPLWPIAIMVIIVAALLRALGKLTRAARGRR